MYDPIERLGEKENFNKVFFANTFIDLTFWVFLEDSKFIKDYKGKLSQWNQYQTHKYINLTWYESWDLILKKIVEQ